MLRVQALLAATTSCFLFAALSELRNPLPPSPPSSPASVLFFTAFFAVLVAVSLAGLVDGLSGLAALLAVAPPPHKPPATRRDAAASAAAWRRPVAYLVCFWALELMYNALLLSGRATAWSIESAGGRARPVFPLRYLSWTSTNAYMLAATALALRLEEGDMLAACAAISVGVLTVLPLELHAVGSLPWLAAAVVAICSVLASVRLVARRVAALLPCAAPSEAAALAALGAAALASYAAFPLLFFAARLCGGEGAGSCLAPRDEAVYWHAIEGGSKVIVTGLVLLCTAVTSRVHECVDARGRRLQGAAAEARQLRVLSQRDDKPGGAPGSKGGSTFAEAVQQSLPLVIAAPALAAAAAFLCLETALAAAAQGCSGSSSGSSSSSSSSTFQCDALAPLKPWVAVLVAAAAAAALAAALDYALRRERTRHMAAAFLPAGFFGEGAAIQPENFDASAMYYVEEPHATLLFADIVGFTPASLGVPPLEVMQTLGELFRHFDALHAAAGATKVEAVGDEYVSVCGATGPGAGAGAGAAPSAAQQALTMAALALALVEAAREHRWASGQPLEVRVGLHCGPLTTGVVGGALPRWGVFGRNVIVASRMESSGDASRVHCSQEFASALALAGEAGEAFVLTPRAVDVKGLGSIKTSWLERRAGGAGGAAAGAAAAAAAPEAAAAAAPPPPAAPALKQRTASGIKA
jgi:class 3 adenylate cyclase